MNVPSGVTDFWNQAKELPKHNASLWALWLWKRSQGKHCILPASLVPFSSAAFQGQGYMFLLCFGIHHHLLFGFNIFFALVQLISTVPEKGLWAVHFLWFIKKILSCNCYLFFEMLAFTVAIRGLYCLLLFYLLSNSCLYQSKTTCNYSHSTDKFLPATHWVA